MNEIMKVIMGLMKIAGKIDLSINRLDDGKWQICVTIDPADILKEDKAK